MAKNIRSDAVQNRAAIIEAAVRCLAADPQASVVEIARAAGVGRVTLYGHFPSRDDLLREVAAQVMAEAEAEIGSLRLDDDPLTALEELASSSWRLIDRFQGVVSAMARGEHAGSSRQDHGHLLGSVRELVRRGQGEGSIRTDLSAEWLTTCLYSILHNAGAESRAGRLDDATIEVALPPTIRSLMGGAARLP